MAAMTYKMNEKKAAQKSSVSICRMRDLVRMELRFSVTQSRGLLFILRAPVEYF